MEVVCFQNKSKKNHQKNFRNCDKGNNSRNSRMNLITDDTESNTSDSELYETYNDDFCLISNKLIKTKNTELSCYRIKAEPMFMTLRILNKKVEMKIDTGAYVSAMSEADKNRIFPTVKLAPCNLTLVSYDSVNLKLLGMLRNVEVSFKGKTKKLDLYIIKGEGLVLLGRLWLKAFELWPLKLNKDESEINKICTEEIE